MRINSKVYGITCNNSSPVPWKCLNVLHRWSGYLLLGNNRKCSGLRKQSLYYLSQIRGSGIQTGLTAWFFCSTWHSQKSAGDILRAGDCSGGSKTAPLVAGVWGGMAERQAQVKWSNGVPTCASLAWQAQSGQPLHWVAQNSLPWGTFTKARQKPHSCSPPAAHQKSWDGTSGAFHWSRKSLRPVQFKARGIRFSTEQHESIALGNHCAGVKKYENKPW